MAPAAANRLLCLDTLLGACVHLARRGGRIIREVHAGGAVGAHNKKVVGDDRDATRMEAQEVLTIADTRAQEAIVSSLRKMFPGIRIVGEEDGAAPQGEAASSLSDVAPLQPPLTVTTDLAQQLTLEDTCVWVDPLDGTLEFVRGNLHNVSVLIGIAVRDRPVAGVVHQPFVGRGADSAAPVGDGTVTYGAVGVGVFGDRAQASAAAPAEFRLAAEAKHAEHPLIKAAAERLGRPPAISQACGQNLLKVLRGESSVFVQAPGASRWDTCAGEALLVAVGGKVTDLTGRPYRYVQGEGDYVNAEGLVAGRTEALHGEVLAALDAAVLGPGAGATKSAEAVLDILAAKATVAPACAGGGVSAPPGKRAKVDTV